MKAFLFLLWISLSCKASQNIPVKSERNYFYILGNFNGEFKSIETQTSNSPKYEYTFNRETNSITRMKNGKVDMYIFYDIHNQLDSVIDLSISPARTTYFYKSNYHEDYAHYSKENGVAIDFIEREFDTLHNSVKFIYNGKLSSIDSFDVNNNLVKRTLLDARTFETYSYDQMGNISKQFIKIRINNKDSLFNIYTYKYEYDERGNWTKREMVKNFPNGNQLTSISQRRITY